MLAVRRQAGLQRRWALEWSGVTIAAPYRPRSAKPANRLFLVFRRCRWVLGDPATWRDLLWTLVNVPVSVVLGLLPAFLLVAFTWTVVVDYGTLMRGWWNVAPRGFLLQVFFLSMLPACVIAGPWLLRMHAAAASSLLSPTRKEMAARVGQLTDSRWDAVDTSAAELRRIERDLHDGAQAQLVALGMNIGFAEQVVRDNPDLHIELPGRACAPVESAAYFAIAEALANAVKHSGANRAWVQLEYDHGRLVAIVGDNGAGGAQPRAGGGLQGIERRLNAFDGMVAVTSPVGGPTQVTMELPCELSLARI